MAKRREPLEQRVTQQRHQGNGRQDQAPSVQDPAGQQVDHQPAKGDGQGHGQGHFPGRQFARGGTRIQQVDVPIEHPIHGHTKNTGPHGGSNDQQHHRDGREPIPRAQPGTGENQRQAEGGMFNPGEVQDILQGRFRSHGIRR